MAQGVKNPSVMQETQVQPLDQEDPLEKVTTTHSSILVWEIPWTEEPGGLQLQGQRQLSDYTHSANLRWHYFYSY